PSAISLTSSTVSSASCQQNPTGSLTLDLTGGAPSYQVIWSNGSTGSSITNVPSGIYTATVTDQNSCVIQFTLSVDTLG
ncbi:UNVERIFIED_CONTAM: hypothetical protein IGO34_36200, partial [Salmonella enterica subsp. enterica serovar Weltevreden]